MPDIARSPTPFLIRASIAADHLSTLETTFPAIDFVQEDTENPGNGSDAKAMLAWGVDAADLDTFPRLRWIQWIGAGVERAPLNTLADRQILLTNSSGVHAPNIAEHVMAIMLAFTRQIPTLVQAQTSSEWIDDEVRSSVSELYQRSLLIVGAGEIGRGLATRAQAFGMDVTLIGRSPMPTGDAETTRRSIQELDNLLPQADHVALCLPQTSDTIGLIDGARLARMKQGSYIYNIGRGSCIVTADLVEALTAGHLAGAGLDVTDPEPLPEDHPLWTLPNVLITSHTAGATPRYWDRLLDILIENINRYSSGQQLRNQVDLAAGY